MISRRSLIRVAPLLVLPRVSLARSLGPGELSGGLPSSFVAIDTLNSPSGTLTTNYGVWGFGQAVNGATGAGPPGPFGTFNYVKLNGKVINRIFRFGPGPVRSGVQQILVAYGGNAFFLGAENDRIGAQYADYDGVGVNTLLVTGNWVDPTSVVNDPLPNVVNTPVSSDGTIITSSPGHLITLDGTWDNNGGGSTWFPNLNGIPFSPADNTHSYTAMEVNCNGNLFLKDNSGGHWFAVLSMDKYDSGSTTIPAGPIPINVVLTPNSGLVTLPNPHPQITTGTSIGTVLATAGVFMSDSSSFAGTLSLLEGPAWVGMSSNNVVTTGTPVNTPVNEYNLTVGASQGGMAACSPGPSTVVLQVN